MAQAEDTVPVEDLMQIVAYRMTTLHKMSQDLENVLSDAMAAMDSLPPQTLKALQRVDYMRQSLKDMSAVLTRIGPDLSWHPGKDMTLSCLQHLVDMQDSLEGLGPTVTPAQPTQDLWL